MRAVAITRDELDAVLQAVERSRSDDYRYWRRAKNRTLADCARRRADALGALATELNRRFAGFTPAKPAGL